MVEWLRFSVRAWDVCGKAVERADFVDRLTVVPGDDAVVEARHGCPGITLLTISTKDFAHVDTSADAGAASEAFAAALHAGLVRAAEWLARQPTIVFEELRASGCVTDLFVGGWMTDDQFDLDLPPEFLIACGELGLTVSICTND